MADGETHTTPHPTPRRRLAALALGSVLLLGGCAADGTASTVTTTTPTASTSTSTSSTGSSTTSTTRAGEHPSPDATAEGEIHVVDQGDLPLRDLRVTPTVGTQMVEMTSTNRVTVESGGQKETASSPTLTQTVAVSVAERGDGRFDLTQEVRDVQVGTDGTAAGRAGVKGVAEVMKGMKTSAIIDRTGSTSDLHLDLPEDAPKVYRALFDQLEDMFAQLSTPVPDEPMGVGGSWTTTQTIDLLGADVDTTVTYTLTSMDESSYTVRAVTKMDAEDGQDIMASGQAGTLDAFRGAGSGESTVRIGQRVAEGQGQSSSDQTFTIDGQTLRQKTRATYRMRLIP